MADVKLKKFRVRVALRRATREPMIMAVDAFSASVRAQVIFPEGKIVNVEEMTP